ncbi:MAG: glycosyltransferase family 2 protein [Patescibacteria group bacterium]
MTNTFTIVTPSYNQGSVLEETILSVLSQQGNFHIEYIIADGGSTDQSVEIIKKYDKLLKKNGFPIKCRGIEFRWWSKKDNGEAAAVNEGFRNARGDILAWISSDDFYESNALNIVLKRFQEDNTVILVHGDAYHYYSKNKKILARSIETNFDDLLNKGNVISVPSVFFTKKALTEAGPLDENLHITDLDLWLRLAKIGKISYVPHILGNFRVWKNSRSIYLHDKFGTKERKKLLKRYGGRRIDPKHIYKIKSKIKLIGYIKSSAPGLYIFIKKIFYKVLDAFRY